MPPSHPLPAPPPSDLIEPPVLTWTEPWFQFKNDSEDDTAYYCPTEDDLAPKPEQSFSPRTFSQREGQPDDTEADDLLFTFSPNGQRIRTPIADQIEVLLRNSPAHAHIFGHVPLALDGSRHTKLTQLVGLLVKVAYPVPNASPKLVYALALQATRLLEQDEDWQAKAWEMANSFWGKHVHVPTPQPILKPLSPTHSPTAPGTPVPDGEDPNSGLPDTGELSINPETGKPFSSIRNIRIGIRMLGARVEYDEFSDRMIVTDQENNTHLLDDHTTRRIWLAMEEHLRMPVGKEKFWDVIQDLAQSRPRHPVREYLNGLKWDGTKRIHNWLTTYLSAQHTPYTQAVGLLFLVAAVRRIRNPGAKFDELLLLEGPQGSLKSSALRTLAVKDDWFSDSLPLSVGSKEVLEQTLGKWIIEAGDLQGMTRKTVDELKAFMSRGTDRARQAYGRMATERPRQFVIAGTTNSDQYLLDSTGNRRFWPVQVAQVDLPRLKADRDQLWAEAAALEAEGHSTRLDPTLYPMAAEQQEDRRVRDPFEETLESVLPETGKLSTLDAMNILGISVDRRTHADISRLGAAMKRLGWTRKIFWADGKTKRGFEKGDGPILEVVQLSHKAGSVKIRPSSNQPKTYRTGTLEDL